MCSWQETVRTPTESWQEGDFRSYWKDLMPKWLEFRLSVDGWIVVAVGWLVVEILGRSGGKTISIQKQ